MEHDPSGDQITVRSHQLLLKAGLIHQVKKKKEFKLKSSSGMYTLLPLANKAIENISKIICEELDSVNCHKIIMPQLLPSNLWKQTGRWESTGAEVIFIMIQKKLIRLKDRKSHEFCLAPTHEECKLKIIKF
jgi:prolyl-tRNA synthetase